MGRYAVRERGEEKGKANRVTRGKNCTGKRIEMSLGVAPAISRRGGCYL